MISYLNCALEAVQLTEKTLSRYFLKSTKAKQMGVEFKAKADLAADKTICSTIKNYFPTHTIVSEEQATPERFDEYTWLIDPIDGTTNFLCGFPIWAISISLVKNNQPFLTVVNVPQFKKIYFARAEKGAFCNHKKIHVDTQLDLKRTVIALDPGYHPQRRKVVIDTIRKLGESISNIAMINSVGATFPLIASGNLQGLIHHFVKIWELPAGLLLLKEAGGQITDFRGNSIIFDLHGPQSISLIASNGKIHQQLVELLNN